MDTQYLYLMGKLGLVIVLMLVAVFFLKRSKIGNRFNNKYINLIGHLSIGTKEKLLLIEVNDKKILLGVTANQIRTLYAFEDNLNEGHEREFADVLKSTVV